MQIVCLSIFVITKGMCDHACLFICDHKLVRGMLFCDHITPIEAISVVKHSKNNSLHVILLGKMTINIYA